MKEDRIFDLNPQLDNLIGSVERLLLSHFKSFNAYRDRTAAIVSNKPYRLIIFIEDTSNSAYIVRKKSNDTRNINPLLLKQIAEALLKYKDDVFGVLYCFGNEQSKVLTGCTLDELQKMHENKILLDKDNYAPLECKKVETVSTEPEQDETHVTIRLYDHL